MSHLNHNSPEPEIDLTEEVKKYLRHWPWFLLSVLAAFCGIFILLQVITPIYSTSATIMIKDGEKNPAPEIQAFSALGILDGMGTHSVENEMGILRSYRLMSNVTTELDLHIQYFKEDVFQLREIYSTSPIKATILKADPPQLEEEFLPEERSFRVTKLGAQRLELIRLSDNKQYRTYYNKPTDLGFAEVRFVRNEEGAPASKEPGPVVVRFGLPDKVTTQYEGNLKVQLLEKNSSLITLQLEDPVPQKAEDILDHLVNAYNQEAIEDKNKLALNTADFINERLEIINEELEIVEKGKVAFKQTNELTDIKAQSQLFITSATDYEKEQQELETQIELVNAMQEYMAAGDIADLLPSNLGIQEAMVNKQIEQYNLLVLERNNLLSGSTVKNPVVINISNRLQELNHNVYESLGRMKANLVIARENLEQKREAISSKIAKVPSKAKEYRSIERQQQIKEALYIFLLQKREENSLSLAATAPKAKIVDYARSSETPVFPKPRIMYLASLILGLLIPFLSIYLRNLLNTKVNGREDLNELTNKIPLVGELPKMNQGSEEFIQRNDRSVLAESFRILHHNLRYLLLKTNGKKTGASIVVTSSIQGEGKTFTAVNLALTLANTSKKVILIGGDLRNPQVKRFDPRMRGFKGVSEYLVNPGLSIEDMLKVSELHGNLHLLASGSIPPNPSELLGQDNLGTLIKELEKRYDYVIIDTAPTLPVVDTFLIEKYVDLTLYVVCAGQTDKKLLEFVRTMKQENKIGDMGIILNAVKPENMGYGNKYDYAQVKEPIKLWPQVRSRASFWNL